MVTISSVLFSLMLAASSRRAAAAGSWEKVYDIPEGQWVIAVWLAKDGSWRASLPKAILIGDPRGLRSTDAGADAIMAFGEDSSGTILGVGVHEAIWQEGASGFMLLHDRHGPRPLEHPARWNVLHGLGYFDSAHPDRLMAYGDADFGVWRSPEGQWRADENPRVAERAVDGPRLVPPSGCQVSGWEWLNGTDGLAKCRNGEGFLYRDAVMVAPLGARPKACGMGFMKMVRDGDRLFTACSDPGGQLWQFEINERHWKTVPGVKDVRAVHARNGCLLVGTRRAIYRRCEHP